MGDFGQDLVLPLLEIQDLAVSGEVYGFRFQVAGHRQTLCDIRL